MAVILCLESSSEVCSVCLSVDGELVHLVESSEPFTHTRKITLFIQECLDVAKKKVNDLDAIAISHGPGSYTGLRVAASTAKGLCFGLDIPLIAIDTLQAIAMHATQKIKASRYVAMIDARRMEVYLAHYNERLGQTKSLDNLIIQEGIFNDLLNEATVFCGTGVRKSIPYLQHPNFKFLDFSLSASFLTALAEQAFAKQNFVNLASYTPNYFKAPRVTKSKKPLF